jgi:hypothetical protein
MLPAFASPPGGELPLLLVGRSVYLLGAFEPPRIAADQVADLVTRCGGKLLLNSSGLETALAFNERVEVLSRTALRRPPRTRTGFASRTSSARPRCAR